MKIWRVAVVLLLLVVTQMAIGKSAVWQVSKGSEKLYVAGSVHLMKPSDYPLPPEFDRAWQQTAVAVFETDLDAGSDPAFQQQLMAVFANPPGVTAQSQLEPVLWEKLVLKANELQLHIDQYQMFHPSFITLLLTIGELASSGIAPQHGVDGHYLQMAKAEGKSVQVLETPAEQISYLASLKEVDANKGVAIALQDIERLESMITDMMKYWRAGDMPELHQLAAESMGQFPEVYEALIVTRNRRWTVQIASMLNSDPVEFVLVGSMHLAGPDSVLKMLAARGYEVTQF